MGEKGTKPTNKWRAGNLQIDEWTNTGKTTEGKEYSFKSYSVQRSYKDKEDKWQNTTLSGLRLTDLPKLTAIATEAYLEGIMKQNEEGEQ